MDAYEQIKVLGKGSFGAAWLVRRRKDRASFVAKEVRLANMKPAEKEEAKHEIAMLRQLNHNNITRYVDHFEARGSLFIVMEYANGGDLYTKIQSQKKTRGRFSEKEVLHYFCQITLALYHMHEKRILHRDLKTQNVFLTADGVIKLGDFGISTVLRNTYEMKRTVCGTPYYFSPELCMNKPYNNKSDIWALGCILYELATFEHAFDGTSMKALTQRILRGVYPPISSSYSKDLRDLIAAMLSTDPTKRPHIAAIVQLPFIRTAMQALQSDVRTANQEKRSCVDEKERMQEKEAAAKRAEQEKAERAKKELAYKAQQKEREQAHQERLVRMREQMAREVKEHEEKLRRIREAEKANDERKKAELAERQKRHDEERKLREKRRAEIEVANRKREEEWERNMKQAKEDAEKRARARAEAEAKEGDRVRAHADAFQDARAQARANRDRALEAERREQERDARSRAEAIAAARDDDRNAGPAGGGRNKQQQAQYDADEARRAFYEMRKQAEENRKRADAERGGAGGGPVRREAPEHHRQAAPSSAPSGNDNGPAPQARKATPSADDDKKQAQARAEAFWEMRRAAEENRKRLMNPGSDVPGSAAPPPAPEQPAPKPRTPPAMEAPVKQRAQQEPIMPPGVRQFREAPPPAPTPAPEADDVPTDEEDDDGDVGYHKFLNNDAAADDDDPNASRQADYAGVDHAIDEVLNDADNARVLEDFGDAEAENMLGQLQLDGRTLQLPQVKAGDPLNHRIESLRMFLEASLGDDNFLAVYRVLSRDEDDAEDAAARIVGDDGAKYIPVVVQLIVCEEAAMRQQNHN
jgi:NIMA (never in mitosis gene a)-related kinase